MQKDYVVWDLETTGLDPKTNHILEIAALVIKDGEVVNTYSTLLNHGIDIPAEASAVHGITKEMCEKEGITPSTAIMDLIGFLTDANVHITHNGFRFDIPFLIESFKRTCKAPESFTTQLEAGLYERGLDTAVLYKARNMQPPLERRFEESFKAFADRVMSVRVFGLKYNVGVCCDTLGIDKSQATQHRALGDITLTNLIYKKLHEN